MSNITKILEFLESCSKLFPKDKKKKTFRKQKSKIEKDKDNE